MSAAPSAEAVIVGAEIAAGHDGAADLLISIRYGNGAISQVALDADTGFAILQSGSVADLAGLIGRSWTEISKGLEDLACTTS
jgi:hypothetical protein